MNRLSVNLPDDVIRRLRRVAEKHGITMTEALRRAIVTEDFLDRATEEGARILLRAPDDSLREIVRP